MQTYKVAVRLLQLIYAFHRFLTNMHCGSAKLDFPLTESFGEELIDVGPDRELLRNDYVVGAEMADAPGELQTKLALPRFISQPN